MSKSEREIKRKLRVFRYTEKVGDISTACRHFGISRQSFYNWKHRLEPTGLYRRTNGSWRGQRRLFLSGGSPSAPPAA